MAEAVAQSGSIPSLLSASERAAAYLGGLLATFALLLSLWRPSFVSHHHLLYLAAFSLSASVALWLRRTIAPTAMLLFLPALPLAFGVLVTEGPENGAIAVAATAFAFHARVLLLLLAQSFHNSRLMLASELEARVPSEALLFIDNDIASSTKTENLQEGHHIRVEQGRRIPADGVLTFGSGVVDESFLEEGNESLEIKGAGSFVHAGTKHKNGPLLYRATQTGSSTFLSRMALRLREGSELPLGHALRIDSMLFAAALAALAISGPALSLRLFLLSTGALCVAFLSRFELGLGKSSCARRWIWRPGGLRKLAKSGMLVIRGPGVLFEGRPRLAAVEGLAPLSQDAAIAMLAPLARKLETPAAHALLRELRVRNIPLKQLEHFSLLGEQCIAILEGEEIRWTSLPAPHLTQEQLGALGAFTSEHLSAGDEVIVLERESKPAAAAAFRDSPVQGLGEAMERLRGRRVPLVMSSPLPKATVHRQSTQLGLEHAQGESGDAEVEQLCERLSQEGLSPAWAQCTAFRPARATCIAALAPFGQGADLCATSLRLPDLADAVDFARLALFRLRCGLAWIFGIEFALVAFSLCYAAKAGRLPSLPGLALIGTLPGIVALAWAMPKACEAREPRAAP